MLFVLLLVALVAASIKPALNTFQSWRQVGETQARLNAVQQENALLERRVKHIQGEAILKREARRQGMIESGERAWVVNGIKP